MGRQDKLSRLDIARAMQGSRALAELHGMSKEDKANVVDAVDRAGYHKAATALARLLGALSQLGLEAKP